MDRNSHIAGAVLFAFLGTYLLKILQTFTIPTSPEWLYLVFFNMDILYLLLLFMASITGGVLPDILDPPFSSRHREIAHSKILLTIFLILFAITLALLLLNHRLVVWILYFFLLGYISHLFMDSFTPAGLW